VWARLEESFKGLAATRAASELGRLTRRYEFGAKSQVLFEDIVSDLVEMVSSDGKHLIAQFSSEFRIALGSQQR